MASPFDLLQQARNRLTGRSPFRTNKFEDAVVGFTGGVAFGVFDDLVSATEDAANWLEIGRDRIDFSSSKILPSLGKSNVERFSEEAGSIIAGVAGVITGYGAFKGATLVPKAFRTTQVGSLLTRTSRAERIGERFVSSAAMGTIVDFVSVDPNAPRLSNILDAFPSLRNPVTDYLRYSPEENDLPMEGRVKNALEGLPLGIATDTVLGLFVSSIRWIKKATWARSGGNVEVYHNEIQKTLETLPELPAAPVGPARREIPRESLEAIAKHSRTSVFGQQTKQSVIEELTKKETGATTEEIKGVFNQEKPRTARDEQIAQVYEEVSKDLDLALEPPKIPPAVKPPEVSGKPAKERLADLDAELEKLRVGLRWAKGAKRNDVFRKIRLNEDAREALLKSDEGREIVQEMIEKLSLEIEEMEASLPAIKGTPGWPGRWQKLENQIASNRIEIARLEKMRAEAPTRTEVPPAVAPPAAPLGKINAGYPDIKPTRTTTIPEVVEQQAKQGDLVTRPDRAQKLQETIDFIERGALGPEEGLRLVFAQHKFDNFQETLEIINRVSTVTAKRSLDIKGAPHTLAEVRKQAIKKAEEYFGKDGQTLVNMITEIRGHTAGLDTVIVGLKYVLDAKALDLRRLTNLLDSQKATDLDAMKWLDNLAFFLDVQPYVEGLRGDIGRSLSSMRTQIQGRHVILSELEEIC